MGLVMGQSYVGTTAIAVAADPPPGVRVTVPREGASRPASNRIAEFKKITGSRHKKSRGPPVKEGL
jgi:predicted acyl esterase